MEFSELDRYKLIKNRLENIDISTINDFNKNIDDDTLNSDIVEIGYFFNSEGIQSMRGISNKNKSEKESKKLFDFLYSSIKELLGKPISENEMLGSKIIQWKNKNSKIFINYNSETCMLSIIK